MRHPALACTAEARVCPPGKRGATSLASGLSCSSERCWPGCSRSPPLLPPPPCRPVAPVSQLDLASGALLDRHSVRRDYVELARNQGAHLRGQLLLVLGVSAAAHSGRCTLLADAVQPREHPVP
jgi:hypothetical protein